MWRLMKTKSWNSFMGKHCLWVGSNIMRYRQNRDVDLSCLVLRRFPWMWQYFSYLISSPFKKTTGNNRDAKSKAQCEMPCPRKHKGNMTRFVFCLLLVHLKGGWGPSNIWVGISVKVIVSAFHTTRQLKWKQNFYPKMEYDKGDLHILKYKWISWFSINPPILQLKCSKN